MKVARVAFALVFAIVLLALPGLASAQAAAVSGTLTYRDRSTLPANAVVTVQIARVAADRGPEVIAEQRFTTNGAQPPFRYSISYDPARIDPNASYTVQSNISVNNQVRYTTNTLYPVITRGNPTQNVNMVLVSRGNLPNTSGGGLPLAVAGVALLGALGVFALRRFARSA
jgi:putative lipoprotein